VGAIFGEHTRIDGVGLSQVILGFGIVANWAGIDPTHWNPGQNQLLDDGTFVATGRLHDHETRIVSGQQRHETSPISLIIGDAQHGVERAGPGDHQLMLTHINTNDGLSLHGRLPSYWYAESGCGVAPPCNASFWRTQA